MTPSPFVSYAQNAEDVVLHRVLGDLTTGHYLEIGAGHPTNGSISRPFYDRGWSGITVESMVNLVEAHRVERPRDIQVHAVAGRAGTEREILGVTPADAEVRSLTVDQILEQNHHGQLHFAVIDTPGSAGDSLAGFDLHHWRPWVLVVRTTAPISNEPSDAVWEPHVLESRFQFCLFDGLSRFYVADEHADDLRRRLSFPANVLDRYVNHRDLETRELASSLTDEVVRWRTAALTRWATAVSKTSRSAEDERLISLLRTELDSTHRTVSWRVTAPLRTVRKLFPR